MNDEINNVNQLNQKVKNSHNIRNSRIEFLRIIAMLMIVFCHFATHGFAFKYFSYNKIFLNILQFGGEFGVNVFIIISAYFSVDSKFKFTKLLKIIMTTWFYSILFLILFKFVITPVEPIGVKQLLMSLLPIAYKEYWFITDYILLMILSPFLNIILNKFEKKSLRNIMLLLLIFTTIICIFIPRSYLEMSSGIIWFVTIYITIGYIKKYIDLSKVKYKKNLKISFIFYLIAILSSIVFNIFGKITNINLFYKYATYFNGANSPFEFIASINLFLAFIKMPKFENKIINLISSATFGVYLIHENIFMRPYLWKTIFNNQGWYYSKYLILYCFGVCLCVYIVATIIDLIRHNTIEKWSLPLILKIYTFLEEKVVKIINKIISKLEKYEIQG